MSNVGDAGFSREISFFALHEIAPDFTGNGKGGQGDEEKKKLNHKVT